MMNNAFLLISFCFCKKGNSNPLLDIKYVFVFRAVRAFLFFQGVSRLE